MRRRAALRSSGAPVGATVVERTGSDFGSGLSRDFEEGAVVIERDEGCGRWLMAKAGVVGVETRLFRGERSEARWRLERRFDRKVEPDRKPGILSPMALTFSRSQSWRISILETLIVGNCN